MRFLALYTIVVLFACGSLPSRVAAVCVEGVMTPHPSDCNAFYVCAAHQQVLRHCPATTHFNPTLNVCDHPAAAGCTATPPAPANDCPAVGGHILLPHPNCRRYYACDYGTPIERQCSGQLEFNAVAGDCDWPHQSGCVEGEAREQPGAVLLPGGGVTTVAPTTDTEEKATRTTPSRPTTQKPTTSRPTKPTEAPTQRPTEATARPTPAPTPKPTKPDTTPAPTPKPTKPPKPDTTPKPPKTPKPTKPAATTPESTTETTIVDETTPVLNGYDCALDIENNYEFLPHPICQKFYICVDGDPVELSCPNGFHYSVSLQHCVQERESVCVEGAAPPQFGL